MEGLLSLVMFTFWYYLEMAVYTGNICKSQHVIYDLLYYIFLNVLKVLFFVLT